MALDPRFKLVFIPATMRMSVKTSLLEELHKLLQQSEQQDHNTEAASQTSNEMTPANSSTTQEESRVTEEEDIWSSLYKSFTQAAQQEQQTPAEDSTVQTLTREMDDYLQLPLLDRNSSELDWWKQHTGQFPYLCVLAKKFLATPASSVYSERLFSEYGNIFEEKRSRLLPTTGEKLLFLHHNMKLLDKFWTPMTLRAWLRLYIDNSVNWQWQLYNWCERAVLEHFVTCFLVWHWKIKKHSACLRWLVNW